MIIDKDGPSDFRIIEFVWSKHTVLKIIKAVSDNVQCVYISGNNRIIDFHIFEC